MYFYAIFLRGVNVGGVKVLMKDLVASLQDAGYTQVRTLLASGNVVLASEETDPARIKAGVEQALQERYGRDIPVIVQDVEQLERIVTGFPFESPDDGIQRHEYLVLTGSQKDAAAILAGAPETSSAERVARLGHAICWEVQRGESLKTPLAKHFAKVASGTLVTTRNMNTIRKIHLAMKSPKR